MKRKNLVLIIAIIVIIAIIMVFLAYSNITGFVVSSQKPSISRTYSFYPSQSKIIVDLYIKQAQNEAAFGISEKIPAGFKVTQTDNNGIIKEDAVEWLFVPGKSISLKYTLVPVVSGAGTKIARFSGSWYAIDSEGNITGKSSGSFKFIK